MNINFKYITGNAIQNFKLNFSYSIVQPLICIAKYKFLYYKYFSCILQKYEFFLNYTIVNDELPQ